MLLLDSIHGLRGPGLRAKERKRSILFIVVCIHSLILSYIHSFIKWIFIVHIYRYAPYIFIVYIVQHARYSARFPGYNNVQPPRYGPCLLRPSILPLPMLGDKTHQRVVHSKWSGSEWASHDRSQGSKSGGGDDRWWSEMKCGVD